MEKMVKFLAIISGKEYFQVLLNPDATDHTMIPGFKENQDEDRLSAIIKKMKLDFDLTVRTISPEVIIEDDDYLIYAGFVSVQHNEDSLQQYQWVHPRIAQRKFNRMGWQDYLEELLGWAASHDFSIELLSNNIDKLG